MGVVGVLLSSLSFPLCRPLSSLVVIPSVHLGGTVVGHTGGCASCAGHVSPCVGSGP